jgi:hypothetical protein
MARRIGVVEGTTRVQFVGKRDGGDQRCWCCASRCESSAPSLRHVITRCKLTPMPTRPKQHHALYIDLRLAVTLLLDYLDFHSYLRHS